MIDPMVYAASLALGMARTGAAVATLPFASRNWAGKHVIIPMSLAVGVLAPAPLVALPSGPGMFLLIAKEVTVGVAVGLMVARTFHVVAASGALLDQQAGYTFAATFNQTLNLTTGPIEKLFSALLTLMLFSDAGAFTLAKGMMLTFQVWPVMSLLPAHDGLLGAPLAEIVGSAIQLMYELALRLAAPAMALLLVADITLMVAARYAQQLNPFSLSLALKALAMSVLLGWMMQAQFQQWRDMLDAAIPVP